MTVVNISEDSFMFLTGVFMFMKMSGSCYFTFKFKGLGVTLKFIMYMNLYLTISCGSDLGLGQSTCWLGLFFGVNYLLRYELSTNGGVIRTKRLRQTTTFHIWKKFDPKQYYKKVIKRSSIFLRSSDQRNKISLKNFSKINKCPSLTTSRIRRISTASVCGPSGAALTVTSTCL